MDELIVYQSLRRPLICPSSDRPSVNIFKQPLGQLNSFYMETAKDVGTKVCSNGPGHVTKMAATPIYEKNNKNILL